MFGIIRPCRHSLGEELGAVWLGHLCGMCLALRDEHGQAARLATNYDGVVISALVQAQSPGPAQVRQAGPCALRGMRRATVIRGEAARLAATVSLLLASTKVGDHVADRDGVFARRPVAAGARAVATRWARDATRAGQGLGLDAAVLLEAVAGQRERERSAVSVLDVTVAAEVATAAAFAHTAIVAGRPENAESLAEAGRMFGRIAHLLDALEDLREDERTGSYNPLTATGTTAAAGRQLALDAHRDLKLALAQVSFVDGALVHALLVKELGHTLGHRSVLYPQAEAPPHERGLITGLCLATWMCCSCQVCCRDSYPGPWSGRSREGWCRSGDCGCDCDCNCCSCGKACKNCDCDCCPCGCD
jgi:hypothetical protein